MSPIKIARRDFRRAMQTSIVNFTENVLSRATGVAAYAALQPALQSLRPLLDDFQTKLTAANNRGLSETLAKRKAQAALLTQLETVATHVEVLAQRDEQLIVDAGFRVQNKQVRFTGVLPKPLLVDAVSTGVRGQIMVVVDDQAPGRAIFTHALEYSGDREQWTNGTYNTKRKFLVNGLPSAREVWVRLRSLGFGERRSEWSEARLVAVL